MLKDEAVVAVVPSSESGVFFVFGNKGTVLRAYEEGFSLEFDLACRLSSEGEVDG